MNKSDIKYLRIFGQSGMSRIDTIEWFVGAGMAKNQAKKASQEVL